MEDTVTISIENEDIDVEADGSTLQPNPDYSITTDPSIFLEKFPKVVTIMDDFNFDQANNTDSDTMAERASCG